MTQSSRMTDSSILQIIVVHLYKLIEIHAIHKCVVKGWLKVFIWIYIFLNQDFNTEHIELKILLTPMVVLDPHSW